MPIYEYRCASCGHQKEYLRRMSDAPLTDCPECGKGTLKKMVTAAGFHLKGSGWYATDFKNGPTPKKSPDKPAESSTKEESKESKDSKEPKDTKEPKAEAASGAGASPVGS